MHSSSTLVEATDPHETTQLYSSQAVHQSHGLPCSYPLGVSFNTLVNKILSDQDITDDALEQFSLEHLAVLDDPAYQDDNVPLWVRRLPTRGVPSFSVRKMFMAMSQTARRLGLPGARYVDASVRACAVFTSQEADPRVRSKRLAMELSKVANTWVAFMLWPFYPEQQELAAWSDVGSDAATPTSNETSSIFHRSNLRDTVLRREDYTCFMTGAVDRSVPADRRAPGTRAVQLVVTQILSHSASTSNTSQDTQARLSATTFDIFRQYCGLDKEIIKNMLEVMGDPQNALLLEQNVCNSFNTYGWSLEPVEGDPNKYHVKLYSPPEDITLLPEKIPTHVVFKDHSEEISRGESASGSSKSGPYPVSLPSRPLLRLHAALASVLQLSGAAEVFEIVSSPPTASGLAVRSKSGVEFMEEVVEYDGKKISMTYDLREAVAAALQR